VRDERLVRRQLGVVLGGDRGLYAQLSARDNLSYFGQLYGMTARSVARRAEEMLDLVGLRDRADERVEGFSRGLKQRLHLAKALLHDPPVLILDEPTIGLDPAAALDLRRAIAALVPAHTVLLTTHDMHEADQLCREIAVVDHGRIVARGSPTQLKARVEADRRVVISTEALLNGRGSEVEANLRRIAVVRDVSREADATGETAWTLRCADTATALAHALALLRRHACPVRQVRVVEPTLEDAFLAITGRRLT
jgi:ABC-2 type transport system ATP-binding protein